MKPPLSVYSSAGMLGPKLTEISQMRAGWDSYDAKPIDPRCIDVASFIMWHFPHGTWQPVPASDGSMQLERHADGLDIEISIRASDQPKDSQP